MRTKESVDVVDSALVARDMNLTGSWLSDDGEVLSPMTGRMSIAMRRSVLSVDRVAAKSRLSSALVRSVAAGRTLPSRQSLRALAWALGVDSGWLGGGADHPSGLGSAEVPDTVPANSALVVGASVWRDAGLELLGPDRVDVFDRLLLARKAAGRLPVAVCADLRSCGVKASSRWLAEVESGRRDLAVSDLLAWADTLEVGMSWLLSGETRARVA